MSSGQRIPRHAATYNINLLRGILNFGLERLEICGSYRRSAQTIGDVDLVALPSNAEQFLDHIDDLVNRDFIQRGKTAAGKESWGEKKRLIHFRGMDFDVAIANKFNFGYQHWLRTGPSEANTLLMGLFAKQESKVRMDDGYLWHVTYHPNYVTSAADKKLGYHKLGRLNVPDEATFFTVLGMPFIEPEKRDEIIYRRYLGKYIPTPEPEILKTYYLTDADEEFLATNGIKQKSLL